MENELISALKKVIELQEKLRDLEKRLESIEHQSSQLTPLNPIQIIGPTIITDTCQHEYPNPWLSITPVCCKKCGKPAIQYSTLGISGSGSTTGNLADIFATNDASHIIEKFTKVE